MSKELSFNDRLQEKLQSGLRYKLTSPEINLLVDNFISSIDDELRNGGEVRFKKAFTIKVTTKTVLIRNPSTGEKKGLGEKRGLKFKASKGFGGTITVKS